MRIAILSLLFVLSSSTAQADVWEKTLTTNAVDSYIQGSDLSILVVVAGENKRDVDAAAAALERALRSSLAIQLVMSDSALGSLVNLGDSAIVKESAHLPADQIFIVRVFPGATPDKKTLVVTMYNKDGSVVGAFSGTSGQALAIQGGQSGGGVSGKTSAVVQSVTRTGAKRANKAIEEYDEKFLWFEEMAAIKSGTGFVVARWSSPIQGKYRTPIEWDEFYDFVGHPELAEEYRAKALRRDLMVIGGSVAAVVGGSVGYWGVRKSRDWDNDSGEDSGYYTAMKWGGFSVCIAGAVVSYVGRLSFGLEPTKPVESHRMADEHNEKLRLRLGLSKEDVAFYRMPEEPELEWALAPAVTPSGSGLVFSLSF